jgi:cation diffusion facilitator CzcD-associated flavoprotein CzcO
MPVNPNIDTAIVGGGTHALTLMLHLLQKRKDMRDQVLVFDPSGTWLNQWQHQFAAQEIPHLRSPAVHHPDPDPFALRRFAESRPNELYPPYDLPGTQLFQDFCQDAIHKFNVADRVVKAKVSRLEPKPKCFHLWLDDGSKWVAKRVVLATNNSVVQMPDWASQIPNLYPRDRLVHSHKIDLRSLNLAGEHILIVGGGLTSGHLAVGAIAQGAIVSLMSRRVLKEKIFDAEPGWLGPKYLKGFAAETDWEKRRQMVLNARDGGSMTPAMLTQLRRMNRSSRVHFYEQCQIACANWQEGNWQIRCEDGMKFTCDYIWLATGTRFDFRAEPLLAEVMAKYPNSSIGGFPLLDKHLRWPGCELFIMGGLSALQVGPTARNLFGARMASDRIVPALTKATIPLSIAA